MTKRKFLLQGIALTAFSLFFRITNIGYRAYLSGKIGAEGMGLYQLIFSVFLLAITLSTSGISLAVTRMVTAAIAANRRCTVRSVVTQCFLFCLTVSYYVYMTAGANKFLRIYYGKVKECLRNLEQTSESGSVISGEPRQ